MAEILVIDDSASVLTLMEQLLTAAGHRVTTAPSGAQGIPLLASKPFDLVITDMYMPERDGMEVMFQARRIAPAVPLIAMSSKPGTLNLFSVAKALGALSTLQKPFDGDQLMTAVNDALNARARAAAGTVHNTDSHSPLKP